MPTESGSQKNEPLQPPKNAPKEVKPTSTLPKEIKKERQSKPKRYKKKLARKIQHKALFEFTTEDGQVFKLTLQQKLFCERYLEFWGNGTTAIIEAGYDVYFRDNKGRKTSKVNYKLAGVMASENLVKPSIFNYINLILKDYGYNDENVKKQHLFLINQHAEFNAKAKGLDMWYKIKGDYKSDKNNDRLLDLLQQAENIPDDELNP